MQTQEFEIMIGNNHHPKNRIAIDINEIPFPTAIYFFSNQEVLLNKRAFKCLGMREDEVFDLTTWRKINPYLEDMIRNIHQEMMIDQKMHVILFNGKHEIMNYSFLYILIRKYPTFQSESIPLTNLNGTTSLITNDKYVYKTGDHNQQLPRWKKSASNSPRFAN